MCQLGTFLLRKSAAWIGYKLHCFEYAHIPPFTLVDG